MRTLLEICEFETSTDECLRTWQLAKYDAKLARRTVGAPEDEVMADCWVVPNSQRAWLQRLIAFEPDFENCEYQVSELGPA